MEHKEKDVQARLDSKVVLLDRMTNVKIFAEVVLGVGMEVAEVRI